MNFEIIDDVLNRFLRLEEEEETDSVYEIRMIQNNQPWGLLPVSVRNQDGKTQYDYTVSGLVSVKECENEDIFPECFQQIIASMDHLSDVLFEHLLSQDKLHLEPEMIFIRKEEGTVHFCYDPGKKSTFRESVRSMMEYFLKALKPKTDQDILFLYGVYRFSLGSNTTLKSLAGYRRDFLDRNFRGNERVSMSGSAGGFGIKKAPVYQDEIEETMEELGLQTAPEISAFDRWRKEEYSRSGKEAEHSPHRYKDDQEEDDDETGFGTSGGRGGYQNGREEKPSGIKAFLSAYRYEIAAALIASAGVVLLLIS